MISPEQLKQYLDVLAKAAQPIGDKATLYYQLAVKQQYFEAFEYLLWTLAGIALMIGGKTLYKWSQKAFEDPFTAELVRFLSFLFGVVIVQIIGVIMICVNLSQAASHFFNAQYWAIKSMLP
jgi:hypothetical protein